MTYFIYANNVNTTLAGAISSSSTSLTLSSSANLPSSIPAGAVFVITINDRATGQNFEVIYATSISGATLSGLLRGQEGTAAQSWLTNDYAYSSPTAGEMNGFGQIGSSNTWTGANTFNDPVTVGDAAAAGQAINQRTGDARYAAIAGNSSQTFEVAQGTINEMAVRLDQFIGSVGLSAAQRIPQSSGTYKQLIIQWGSVSAPANSNNSYALPVSFISGGFACCATRAAGGSNAAINASPNGTSNITIQNYGSSTETVDYIIIGM